MEPSNETALAVDDSSIKILHSSPCEPADWPDDSIASSQLEQEEQATDSVTMEDATDTVNVEEVLQAQIDTVSTSQESHDTRQTGLSSTKMTKKGDLKRFKTSVWSHLQDKGHDSIAYLLHAVDSVQVSSVATEYTRFSITSATK
jgi:hypothetical protein